MNAIDDLPTFFRQEIPDLEWPMTKLLDRKGELHAVVADGPVIATVLPVVQNMGRRQVGSAMLFRVRYMKGLHVRVRITDDGVRAHLRAQGPSPGTVTEICRDGILTGISVNTGAYRTELSDWGLSL